MRHHLATLLLVVPLVIPLSCKKKTTNRAKRPPMALVQLPQHATQPWRQPTYEIEVRVRAQSVVVKLLSPFSDPKRMAALPPFKREIAKRSRAEFQKVRQKETIDGKLLSLQPNLRVQSMDKLPSNTSGYLIIRLKQAVERLVELSKESAARQGLLWTPNASLLLHPETPYRTIVELIYTLGQAKIAKFQFAVDSAGTRRGFRIDSPKYKSMGVMDPPDKPEPKVMSVTLTLRRASIELAAEERESQEIKYLRKVRVQPKLDPSGKSKSPTVVETSKRIVERPRRWTLKRSIPRKSARDEEALLMLHEQISACRKRNPRLYLTVAADPDQAWRHIARLLAVASVVHQGASFKTLHALLNAPPIGGRNAYVPVTLSLAE